MLEYFQPIHFIFTNCFQFLLLSDFLALISGNKSYPTNWSIVLLQKLNALANFGMVNNMFIVIKMMHLILLETTQDNLNDCIGTHMYNNNNNNNKTLCDK